MGVREGQNMAQNYPHIAPYCSLFWPSLTPPVDPVNFFWFKMVCTCVPHIVLHVLSSTSTWGGYFRPQKSILAKIALFGCFWGLFLTLGARNENLRPLFNTNIPQLVGNLAWKYRQTQRSQNHLTDLRSQIELAAWFRRFSIDGADGTNSIHHSYAREIQISTDCTCTYCQQYVYVWNTSPCTKQIEI